MKYQLHYVPGSVPVSDDRKSVDGARCVLNAGPVRVCFDVIPPEGGSIDCWIEGASVIERLFGDDLSSWVEACARAAILGSDGAAGRIEIEVHQ